MATSATPSYMGFIDDLFGSQGHMGYLDNMTAQGSPKAGLALPTAFASATEMSGAPQAAANATSAEASPLSGETVNIEGLGPVPIEKFNQWRESEGLADPNAFKMSDYEAYAHGGGYERGENSEWQADLMYRPKEGTTAFSNDPDAYVMAKDHQKLGWGMDPNAYQNDSGVMAFAGKFKDDPKNQAIYNYDKDGKFEGMHFSTPGGSFKDDLKAMAPALTFLLMPFLPGLGAAVAGSLQAAVPALGAMGSSIAGGAVVGGGLAAATGGNIAKGALTGGIGAGISAVNPAGALGVADKATAGLVNSGISTAVKTGINASGNRR